MQNTTRKVLAKLGFWFSQGGKYQDSTSNYTHQDRVSNEAKVKAEVFTSDQNSSREPLHLVTDNLLAHRHRLKVRDTNNAPSDLEYLSSGVLYKIGTELLKCKDYDRSLEYFAAILKKEPYSKPTVEQAVEALLAIGYQNDAKTLCEKYLSRHPGDQSILSLLCSIYDLEKQSSD